MLRLVATMLVICIIAAATASSARAAVSRQSPVLSQTRFIPNPAGANAATDGSNRLVWTNSANQAVLYDLRTKKASVVAVSQSVRGAVSPVGVNGHWLVYLDDPEVRWTGTTWQLKAKDLRRLSA